jgi:hypothetical protein
MSSMTLTAAKKVIPRMEADGLKPRFRQGHDGVAAIRDSDWPKVKLRRN